MSTENRKIKFENYVYLSICEMLVNTIHETKCTDLYGYCNSIKYDLDNNAEGVKSFRYMALYSNIYEYLKLIYDLDESECGYYLYKFINDNRYKDFEKSIMVLKKYFGYELGSPTKHRVI